MAWRQSRAGRVTGGSPAHLHVEADADHGVAPRVLDLLCAADCFPDRMSIDRDGPSLLLSMQIGAAAGSRIPIAARLRQIPGVRRVVETVHSP